MQKINELIDKRSDLEKLEIINNGLLELNPQIYRALEILTEDLRRKKLGLDIPDNPSENYGRAI